MSDRVLTFLSKLKALFTQRGADSAFEEEMRAHLEMLAEKYEREGMSSKEAARAARRQFGNTTLLRQRQRESRTTMFFADVWRDISYAVRSLARDLRFSLLAILALTLGLGSATIIFSAVYGVLLNTFPFRDAHQIVSFAIHDMNGVPDGGREYLTIPELIYFREHSGAFQDISGEYGGLGTTSVLYKQGDSSYSISSTYMSVNSFEFFGVNPIAGRLITPADTAPGATPTFMMSERLWRKQFNADPNIIGKSFLLDGVERTLTGIMSPRFRWGWSEIWIPVPIDPGQVDADPRLAHTSMWCVGRLKPSVSLKEAAADLDVMAHQRARYYPEEYPAKFTVSVVRLTDRVTGPFKTLLHPLLISVLMLLLIACGNVANLLLARATAREREIAVRAALGAGRGRLIRQFLVESFVLAGAGCLAGWALAFVGLKAIVPLIPYNAFPQEATIELNSAVLGFSLVLALTSTILCGLAPALHLLRRDLPLRTGSPGHQTYGGLMHERLRSALVVAQVAFSVTLLIGSGLFLRTFLVQTHVNTGFQMDKVLTARLSFANLQNVPQGTEQDKDQAEKKRVLYDLLLQRVGTIPGVAAVSESIAIPPASGPILSMSVIGKTLTRPWQSELALVTDGYFRTLGISLLQGRLLSDADVRGSREVAVVNQTLVQTYFGADNPIGRRIRFAELDQAPNVPHGASFEIVGVVADAKNQGIKQQVLPEAYLPANLMDLGERSLLVKTSLPPESMLPAIRREVWKVSPDIALADPGSLQSVLERDEFAFPRFEVIVLSFFALTGLVLIGIGIFSVMSYTVSLKTHEIGIRMAFGAERNVILRMVLNKGLALIAMGASVGLAASLYLTRLFRALIWGVSPSDPWTYVAVIAFIFAFGAAASLLPALRAAAGEPTVALRHE